MEEQKGRREYTTGTTRGALGAGMALTAANWKRVLDANDRIN